MRQFQGVDDLLHPTRIIYDVTLSALPVCALYSILLQKYVLNLKRKSTCYFSSCEGFDECMHVTCGAQFLQKG